MSKLLNDDWQVSPCERQDIRDFIEQYHYSKNINGVKSNYCFKLLYKGTIVGAMLYGTLGMANAWKKYGDREEDVLELRRLVLIDDTPRNAESFFIGHTLRWLKAHTEVKTIVSYADPNYGHSGVIYRATNFQHVGMTSKGRVIMWNNKKYHDKTIRTKYKGELKPFALKVKEALDRGEAYYVTQEPKHIYVKHLRKQKKSTNQNLLNPKDTI